MAKDALSDQMLDKRTCRFSGLHVCNGEVSHDSWHWPFVSSHPPCKVLRVVVLHPGNTPTGSWAHFISGIKIRAILSRSGSSRHFFQGSNPRA